MLTMDWSAGKESPWISVEAEHLVVLATSDGVNKGSGEVTEVVVGITDQDKS